eukprot:TRINITY_DN4701_c0_g1_i1.p1 TRINITY_DN4701_c0_g1~~TRINITY_DN4701_c0_g1_i1.p1  ORF type:complete len:949 (+),score=126.79 TRINITY_DN4701_c0_g1_i1:71-2848(+)
MEGVDPMSALSRTADLVQTFVERNGAMSPQAHEHFWRGLTDGGGQQPAMYLTVLIAKYIALETGDTTPLVEVVRKLTTYEPSGDITRIVTEDSDVKKSLLATIYFIALYYPFDPVFEPLKAAVGRWIKVRSRTAKPLDFVDECLRMLVPGYLQSTEGIISLVEACSNSELPSDFCIDTAATGHIAPCLVSTYLRNYLSEGRDPRVIFDNLLLFLMHPRHITEPRLLSLLHMLRTFITTCPYVDPATVEKAITFVRSYYLWPCPYGDVAKDMLQLLTVELKSPGSALRAKFVEENPELERGYQPTGKERTVHILLDEETEAGKTLQLLIQSTKPEEVTISQLQVNLLINILETNLRLDCELLGLEFCSREDTASFYYTAIEILHQALLMSEKDAAIFRQQKLTILKDYIISRSTTNRRATFTSASAVKTSFPPPLVFDFLPITCHVSDSPCETDYKYPRRISTDVLLHILKQYTPFAERPRPTVIKIGIAGNDRTLHDVVGSYVCLRGSKPALFSNLHLQFYLLPVEHSHLATFIGKSDGWYGRHVLCVIDCAVRVVPSLSVATTGAGLRSNSHAMYNSGSEVPASSVGLGLGLGIGPGASSGTMTLRGGTLVGSQVGLGSPATPKKGIGLLFSDSVPTSNSFSNTSSSISSSSSGSSSGMGGSGTGSPSSSSSAAGKKGDDKSSATEKGGEKQAVVSPRRLLTPSSLLRTELQNYFREARNKLEMNIYQAECWGAGGQQYYTIPFCMRAIIGYEAQTRAFFVANGVDERLAGNMKEVEREGRLKTFKFAPLNLHVKFLQMNVQGVPRQGLTLEPKPYHTLTVSNIPIQGDRCTPPDPTKPWLEMYALEYDKKRKTKVSDEHLYHVSQVEVEVKEKDRRREPFHILLDGVLYGPFDKVKIGMCMTSRDESAVCHNLTVMSYFPLVL